MESEHHHHHGNGGGVGGGDVTGWIGDDGTGFSSHDMTSVLGLEVTHL